MKIHNVFSANLLNKASIDTLRNLLKELLTLVIMYNKPKWEIEDIFDIKNHWYKY